MHSLVSPDPIGIALAWLPVALGVFAAFLALSISSLSLLTDVLARRYGRPAEKLAANAGQAEPSPGPA